MKLALTLTALTITAAAAFAIAQPTRPQQGPVAWMELPLKFPVVGNIDAVRQWRFGRLQAVEDTAGPDLILRIRIADGSVLRIFAPGPQLRELCVQSNWVRTRTKTFPGRQDYAERMIAFDYDENMRLIAMASLEPINRDRRRLRQALV